MIVYNNVAIFTVRRQHCACFYVFICLFNVPNAYIHAGLLISNIDIDIDTIDDTFEVSISISTILSRQIIDSGIDDTFSAVFIDTSISILFI